MSISGDYPIFSLRIDGEADIGSVREALRMQEYLRSRGVISDLVIINERSISYAQDLNNAISRTVRERQPSRPCARVRASTSSRCART